MNLDDVRELLKKVVYVNQAILLDDGEFYIQADSDSSGMLLRICSTSLLEEDDAECHGGYSLNSNGIWMVNFASNLGPENGGEVNNAAECDDREHAIAVLWLLRVQTAGYRTGNSGTAPIVY
jgi:hypothetical protein